MNSDMGDHISRTPRSEGRREEAAREIHRLYEHSALQRSWDENFLAGGQLLQKRPWNNLPIPKGLARIIHDSSSQQRIRDCSRSAHE